MRLQSSAARSWPERMPASRRIHSAHAAGASSQSVSNCGCPVASDAAGLPSHAVLVCWPFRAGPGEDVAGGVGEWVRGGVLVAGDVDGDLLQRA